MRKWLLIPCVLASLVIGVVLLRAFWPLPPVTLVVSEDTTYFTEPLNPDGTVDYAAAFNEIARGGVTAENNAAIDVIRALGRDALPEATVDQLAAELGISSFLDEDRFVPLLEFVSPEFDTTPKHTSGSVTLEVNSDTDAQELSEGVRSFVEQLRGPRTEEQGLAEEHLSAAVARPWLSETYPVLDRWLDRNELSLDAIVSASDRSEFYVPMVSDSDPPIFGPPLVELRHKLLDAGDALICRSMRRLAHDDVDGALADLRACMRLSDSVAGASTGCENLIGLSLANVAREALVAIAVSESLTAHQARQLLREIKPLPDVRRFFEAYSRFHRLLVLDIAVRVSRDDAKAAGRSTSPGTIKTQLDVNHILLEINKRYDQFDSVIQVSEFIERTDAMYEWRSELESEIKRIEPPNKDERLRRLWLNLSSSNDKRRVVSNALLYQQWNFLEAHASFFLQTDWKSAAYYELLKAALALAAYHYDHGQYPRHLVALTPEYLSTVPEDVFNGDDLRYESDGDDYRIWSVGMDRTDDGGERRKDFVVTTGD